MNSERDYDKKDWTENVAEETETLVDKAKGLGNQVKGHVKDAYANLTDDHLLHAEAEADKLKGKAQVEGAKAEDFVRDTTEDVVNPLDEMAEKVDEMTDKAEDHLRTEFRDENFREGYTGDVIEEGYREGNLERLEEEIEDLHRDEKL